MAFPPRLEDLQGTDGSIVVPARVSAALVRIITIAVRYAREYRDAQINTDMVVLLDAITESAKAAGSVVGTTVSGRRNIDSADEALTVSEAAARCDCSPRAIRKAIMARRLVAQPFGSQWLIWGSDLEDFRFGKGRKVS